jgi:hypothetical protein
MTMKWTTMTALVLLAPAAFAGTAKVVPVKGGAHDGQVKILRQEIKRDKDDLSAKWKAGRAQTRELNGRMKAELAKVKETKGTRAEKAAARKAVREKYAGLLKEARARSASARRGLREDMAAKSALIKSLRRS